MKGKAIFCILFLISLMFGCDSNDVLKEEPRDFFSPDQLFTSDEGAIGAVNGLYQAFYRNPFFGPGPSWDFWSHPGTDLSRPSGGREVNFPQHVYSLSASNATVNFANLDTYWRELYRAIGDANLVINRVPNSEGISEEVGNRVVGEAKFLRAYLYYWTSNFWGDVPLWTDELDIDEVAELPRAPVEEVRNQMVEDLLDAEASLPSTYSGADLGRASKWAAKMLLCKVYLWQEDYQNAREVANDIIVNSPHSLLDNYEDIFGVELGESGEVDFVHNEYNDERIWEIEFVEDQHNNNRVSKYRPRQIDEPEVPGFEFNGFGLITAADEFVESFDPSDRRRSLYWSGANGVETNFNYVLKNIDWNSARGNDGVNLIVFRLADAYLMFAEAENELNGPTQEAYNRINTVRQRAGVPELSGLSQEEFRQAIMDERKWELAFEHHRRWDLNRWGQLVEAVRSLSETNPQGADRVQDYHMLAPIPPAEISKNPNLAQNPGY